MVAIEVQIGNVFWSRICSSTVLGGRGEVCFFLEGEICVSWERDERY